MPPDMMTKVMPRAMMPIPALPRSSDIQFCIQFCAQAPKESKLVFMLRAMVWTITITASAMPVLNRGLLRHWFCSFVRSCLPLLFCAFSICMPSSFRFTRLSRAA